MLTENEVAFSLSVRSNVFFLMIVFFLQPSAITKIWKFCVYEEQPAAAVTTSPLPACPSVFDADGRRDFCPQQDGPGLIPLPNRPCDSERSYRKISAGLLKVSVYPLPSPSPSIYLNV